MIKKRKEKKNRHANNNENNCKKRERCPFSRALDCMYPHPRMHSRGCVCFVACTCACAYFSASRSLHLILEHVLRAEIECEYHSSCRKKKKSKREENNIERIWSQSKRKIFSFINKQNKRNSPAHTSGSGEARAEWQRRRKLSYGNPDRFNP